MVTILKIDKLWYKTKWIHSIRVKLAAIYIGISVITLFLFSSLTNETLDKSFLNERTQELLRKANITAVHISKNKYMYNQNYNQFTQDLDQTAMESQSRIVVCNLNSTVIYDTSGRDNKKILITPEIMHALSGNDVTTIFKQRSVMIGVPIKSQNDKVIGCVYVEDNSNMLYSIKDQISRKVVQLSIIAFIVLSIVVYFATGFITVPLKNMLKIIDKMADGEFDERIKVTGHDELAELSMAFNQMSAKLQKIDANRQEFVSNVSHELKTPLSSMKVLIETLLLEENVPQAMYKEFLEDTNSEIDRLTDIINHLLTLVKLDVKVLPLSLENINMTQMVEGIIKRLMPLATKKNLSIEYEEEKSDIIAEIDKINITLAISNLIENGIKYTDEGKVSVKIDSDHQNVYITVTDTGRGMAEEEQTKIFDRFYRIDKTRDRQTGGTGLGLAITHRAIILHGGSIKVTSQLGEGTTFLVRIPLKQGKKE